jgi:PEGA domain
MYKNIIVVCALLAQTMPAQEPRTTPGVAVEVVATAAEYVPRYMTYSHPGHSYTSCVGNTSFWARFNSDGDSGSISGTAETDTNCSRTWNPPTTSTTTLIRQYNYTIVKSENALYLVACNPRTKVRGVLSGLSTIVEGATTAAGGNTPSSSRIEPDYQAQKCVQSFGIGTKYLLTIDGTHVLLDDMEGSKPVRLDYVSSVGLATTGTQPASSSAPLLPPETTSEKAIVHVTSAPSGGEIYIDGKFFGNAPSDITLSAGEHTVKVTVDGREWSRSVEITSGEISVQADLTGK